MLKSLSISNYALISSLEVEFRPGLNMITGETGAGKSILLGALGLLLGNRADSQVLKEKDLKCTIEAEFDLAGLSMDGFFETYDLDKDAIAIVRREITPQGKSRAFINDTPVNLNALRDLGLMMVDIHSQHQNLLLNDPIYALHVIDRFGSLETGVMQYAAEFQEWRSLERQLAQKKAELEKSQADQDYLEFQLGQLEQAALVSDELEELEKEQEMLEHAGDIQTRLGESVQLMHESEDSIETRLKQVITGLQAVAPYFGELKEPLDRLQSVYIEIQETSRELSHLLDHAESNPQRLQVVIDRIDLINTLLKKHHVAAVEELIGLREQYRDRLSGIQFSDEEVNRLTDQVAKQYVRVKELANGISLARQRVWPSFVEKVTGLARDLGMPNAQFSVDQRSSTELNAEGQDEIRFLFSANKNQSPEELSKVASGGETSRLMLSIKSLIHDTMATPTVIFDEIDSGVSGDIADKVGNLISRLSAGRQVLNITHLPQVASKGDYHFLVYKYDDEQTTHTSIRLLSEEERINELAKMLSGEKITPEAIQNARVLLGRDL
jgi:DNA repair protein RecN (Recombination protein N)